MNDCTEETIWCIERASIGSMAFGKAGLAAGPLIQSPQDLAMALDCSCDICFFKILFFLLGQFLSPSIERFVHSATIVSGFRHKNYN